MPDHHRTRRAHTPHARQASTWLLSVITLGLVVLLGPAAHVASAPEEGVEEAKAAVAKATAAFESGDFAAAAAAYREAIKARFEVYADEEDDQALTLRKMGRQKELTSSDLIAKLRANLETLDALAAELASYELGLARAEAAANHSHPAVEALARALGHQLDLEKGLKGDKHLASLRKGHAYKELRLRLDEDRLSLVADEPLLDELGRRDFAWRLRLPRGDPRLDGASPIVRELRRLAIRKHDVEAPERLSLESYLRLIRLGQLRPSSHSGWAFRHSHLFDHDDTIKSIQSETRAGFERTKGAQSGVFWALAAVFPALHQGDLRFVRSVTKYLETRAPSVHTRVLNGTSWVLKAYLGRGASLPNTTTAECDKLRTEVESAYYAQDLRDTRQNAWMGHAWAMSRISTHYADNRYGKKNAYHAFAWAKGSHELGNTDGTMALAHCHLMGIGTNKDKAAGLKLHTVAAARGSGGLHSIGYIYQFGRGVKQDYAEALRWYAKAAEGKSGDAMESIGVMTQRGLGTEQDYEAAITWFMKGAMAGNTRCYRRAANALIDASHEADALGQAVKVLELTRQSAPEDVQGALYMWVVLELQNDRDAARALASAWLEKHISRGAEEALFRQMAAARIDTRAFLRIAKREKDADARKMAIGRAHYLAGIQMLASDDQSGARKQFKKSIKGGLDIDSVRFSAIAELKRLEAAGK